MQFRDIDLLNYRLQRVQQRINYSIMLLKNAAAGKERIAISFSGGKDSLACLLLCIQAELRPELVWFNSGYEYPETPQFVRYCAKKAAMPLREIQPELDPLAVKLDVGFFDLPKIAKANKKILSPWWRTNKEYDLVITGLRMQESSARKMTIARNGQYFFNKSFGAHVCYPVAQWQARDVFAYITGNFWQYHPIYDRAKTLDERDWIRVNWYILSIGNRGFYVFLKREYPELYTNLAAFVPEVRCYV